MKGEERIAFVVARRAEGKLLVEAMAELRAADPAPPQPTREDRIADVTGRIDRLGETVPSIDHLIVTHMLGRYAEFIAEALDDIVDDFERQDDGS